MAELHIRPAQLPDVRTIDFGEPGQLQTALEGAHPQAVVAESGRSVVGYAIATEAIVHRTRRWLDIAVSPRHRRRGIGRRLLAGLSEHYPDPRPYATKVSAETEAHIFAEALGGHTYAQTPHLELPHRTWPGVREKLGDIGSTVSGATLPTGRLTDLWEQQYRWVHESWSPVADSRDAKEALRAEADEADPELTSVTLDSEGRPGAVAFCFDDPGGITVIVETVARDTPGGDHLVRRALGRVLDQMEVRGLTTLFFDGHESDPHFGPLAASLPLVGPRTLLLEIPVPASV